MPKRILSIAGLVAFVSMLSTVACLSLQAAASGGSDSDDPATVVKYRISEDLGRNDAAFHFRENGSGYSADRFAAGLKAVADANGLRVQSGTHSFGVALERIGSVETGIVCDPAVKLPESASNRLSFSTPSSTDWYVNGPGGFQQGWTVSHDIGGDSSPLELVLRLSGDLAATIGGDRHSLSLSDADGLAVLTYGGLYAYDATGRHLPAIFERVDASRVRICVDDAGAQYPVTVDPWVQSAQLLASDKAADDYLGNNVAISADGTTVVAGASYSDPGGTSAAGAVYVFVKPGGGWANATQTAKLTASDKTANAYLGSSVKISDDGSTIVAGAIGWNGVSARGAMYVYVKPGGGWADATETARLTASDAANFDQLGTAVSVSSDGEVIVAGAYADDTYTGSAYVFVRPVSGWVNATQTAKLTASDRALSDNFGHSVAVSGDGQTIAVSSSYEDPSAVNNAGSLYVFTKPGGGWANATETAKLSASDAAANDALGYDKSVDISSDGSTIVAGAEFADLPSKADAGAVYVFSRPGGGWVNGNQSAKLTASDAATSNNFGRAVAVTQDGTVLAVGDAAVSAVYLFKKGTGWTNGSSNQSDKLTNASGFGQNVGISSDGYTVVSGAWSETVGGVTSCGAVYVHEKTIATPTTQASTVTFSNVSQTQMDIAWTVGDGDRHAVFLYAGTSGTPSPVDGASYAADAAFGSGDEIGASGWYCVYSGSGGSVTVTGLTLGTTYRAMVCEYNGFGGTELYLTSTATGNPANKITLAPPVIDQGAGPLAVTMSQNGSPIAWSAPTLGATDASPSDTLTWSVSTPASHGTATVSGTGASPSTFTYAPTTDWYGNDTFVVQVSDGAGGTDTISVDVTVENSTPNITAWPTASAITYGQALSNSTLSGGTASVAGAFAFTAPATTPAAGAYSASVTFTPTDLAHYNPVVGSVSVTVNLATPNVNTWPTASAINYGQALSSSTLTGGAATVAGSFAFTAPATTPSAGPYSASVTFTPTDTSNYNPVVGSVSVTVNKATPNVTAWPTAGAITYGQALSSSTLTGGTASVAGGFAFTAPATTPAAGPYSASVTFTPTDTTNYNTVVGSVNVTVNKATPNVTAWPTASAITYGDALSSSTLSGGSASVAGGFAFVSPATVPPAGPYSASVRFTPTDTSNYNTVTSSVSVTVNKATPSVSEWPTATSIAHGQTLASSTLSGGSASVPGAFTFDAPGTAPSVGIYSAAVTFTPTNASNYYSVSGSVNVTVTTAAPSVSAWPTATAITFGQALSSSSLTGGSASVPGSFAFTSPATIPSAVGVYSASVTFTPTDSVNYSAVVGSVNVTVSKATPDVTAWPTAGAITFGQALSSSSLTGGTASVSGAFAFTAPATVPAAGGTYSASVTFTPTDSTNYSSVVSSVNVTVNKATPNITAWPAASVITYGQTLASSTLTGGTASVPGSFAFTTPTTAPATGLYSASVTFTPTASGNYNPVVGSVNVTVNKATPNITAWPTASAIDYWQALSASTLTGGSASVAGSFGFTSPSTVPPAGNYSASVTFTPSDTTNYANVTGSVQVHVNGPPTGTPPYLLTGPAVTAVSNTSALVEWSTDRPAQGQVSYGTTQTNLNHAVSDTAIQASHSTLITGLTAGVQYYVAVATHFPGQSTQAQSHTVSFTASASADTVAPLIVQGPAVTGLASTSFLLELTTDEASSVELVLDGGTAPITVAADEITTRHDIPVTGLTPGTAYDVTITLADPFGNEQSYSVSVSTLSAQDTTAPFIVEGPVREKSGQHLATLRWETDEPATAVVEYGTTPALGTELVVPWYSRVHSVTVTGLSANTDYYFAVRCTDLAGNGPTESANILLVHTAAAADTTSPVLTLAPYLAGKTNTTATLYWETDEPADTVVQYGTSTAALVKQSARSAKTLRHEVTLTHLTPGTRYYFRCLDSDTALPANTTSYTDTGAKAAPSFQTDVPADTTSPAITDGPHVVGTTNHTLTVYWVTNEIASSTVYWRLGAGETHEVSDGTLTTGHLVTIGGLAPSSTYTLSMASVDAAGNAPVESAEFSAATAGAADTAPPVFSVGPQVGDIGTTSAVVSWSTNEYASGDVSLGVSPADDDNVFATVALDLTQSVLLTGLAPGTTYRVAVRAVDQSENVTESTALTFTTTSGGSTPCFIATAAYGTPLDKSIDVLRRFRDQYLLSSAPGTALVDAYYRLSPSLADMVAKSPWLAVTVRTLLIPVLMVVPLTEHASAFVVLTLLVAIFAQGWRGHKKHGLETR